MTTDYRALPDPERIKELFHYNQEEGALYWRQRHNSQIDLAKPAGWLEQSGYRGVRVDGVKYKRHRVIWCLFNGDPGAMEIDHINRIKGDDRIENLRAVTKSQNQLNRSALVVNKSGYKGVDRQGNKYRAQITDSEGRKKHLGFYDTPQEAAEAYLAAAVVYHGEFCFSPCTDQ